MIALATSVLKATGLGAKVGEWLGGDSGEKAAGKVLDIAEAVTGEDSPDKAAASIAADPEQARLAKKDLLDHEAEILRIHLEDRQDARAMQTAALAQDDLFSKRFVYYLAAFWSVVGASYVYAITFVPIPETSVRFADTALGFILGTIIAGMIQFFFGSSAGSSAKTAMLKDQLAKLIK